MVLDVQDVACLHTHFLKQLSVLPAACFQAIVYYVVDRKHILVLFSVESFYALQAS
jgi:hypothetical protein